MITSGGTVSSAARAGMYQGDKNCMALFHYVHCFCRLFVNGQSSTVNWDSNTNQLAAAVFTTDH